MGKKLKIGDLFAGIGGFSLGLERAGMETAFFCEIEPFCQKVLKKNWPAVPIYEDVRNLDYDGSIDVICGGYPCQPFSVAGKQKGEKDDRHLWPFMFKLIQKHRPRWVIGENVAGHVNMGLDNVLADLEAENYSCQAFVIPACAVNAPHRRDRVWIVAHSDSESESDVPQHAKAELVAHTFKQRCHDGSDNKQQGHLPNEQIGNPKKDKSEWKRWESWISENTCDVADSNSIRSSRGTSARNQKEGGEQEQFEGRFKRTGWGYWQDGLPTSRICRSNDGISNRTHRLRALGNAVVPQIPEALGRAILEVERIYGK